MKRNNTSIATVAKRNRENKRKECEHGKSCPYINEYQHQLEFSHDNQFIKPVQKRDETIFSGKGNRIGSSNSALVNRNQDDLFLCEICSRSIPISVIELHIINHERNGEALKKQQEYEYEQSVINDLKRQHKEEMLTKEKIKTELDASENKVIEELLAASLIQFEEDSRKIALKSLVPEPPNDDNPPHSVVCLKFTLPGGVKLVRKFASTSLIQDAFIYLRTRKELGQELIRKGMALRSPEVGSPLFLNSDTRTFEAAKIKTNSSFVVVSYSSEKSKLTNSSLNKEKISSTASSTVIDLTCSSQ